MKSRPLLRDFHRLSFTTPPAELVVAFDNHLRDAHGDSHILNRPRERLLCRVIMGEESLAEDLFPVDGAHAHVVCVSFRRVVGRGHRHSEVQIARFARYLDIHDARELFIVRRRVR